MTTLIIEITGYTAVLLSLLAYVLIQDSRVVNTLIFSALFRTVHLLFLGAYSGAFITILFIFRLATSRLYQKNNTVFGIIIFMTFVLGYFTYQGLYSLLPLLASLIGTYAFFYKSGIELRLYLVLLGIIWGAYYFAVGSISLLINEIIVQGILYATIYRMMKQDETTIIGDFLNIPLYYRNLKRKYL